ncbi:MAG: uracil phosphoribosyltransferase [Cryobacterium sp.]|nr:uracil phosphoribosyltransferase [Oligoflexia bacterium]
MRDRQFEKIEFRLSELEHHYGPNVHLLSDPFLLSLLARLCANETVQPVINELVGSIYSSLMNTVVAREFPTQTVSIATRMSDAHPQEAVYVGPNIDSDQPVVTVNLARAGTLPSHICYTALNYFMNPKRVRQDHISIGRIMDHSSRVTGSQVSGHKIGGPVDESIVLFPDPMGATGGTLVEAISLYKRLEPEKGVARKYIALHCIVTPEYLLNVTRAHPDLVVYAVRLDRGLSSDKVLASKPGEFWREERGLNEKHYIVPGGGGFGEVMNNAYV